MPSCDFFPLEAVKTNAFRMDNVLTAWEVEQAKFRW